MEHPDLTFRVGTLTNQIRLAKAEERAALLGRVPGPVERLVAQACLYCRLTGRSATPAQAALKRAA